MQSVVSKHIKTYQNVSKRIKNIVNSHWKDFDTKSRAHIKTQLFGNLEAHTNTNTGSHRYLLLTFFEFSFSEITSKKNKMVENSIVMLDSRTNSSCLCYYVQNGLSYSGKETRPKLCIKQRQAKIWRQRS